MDTVLKELPFSAEIQYDIQLLENKQWKLLQCVPKMPPFSVFKHQNIL